MIMRVKIKIKKRQVQENVYNGLTGKIVGDVGKKNIIELDEKSKYLLGILNKKLDNRWTTQPIISKENITKIGEILSIL